MDGDDVLSRNVSTSPSVSQKVSLPYVQPKVAIEMLHLRLLRFSPLRDILPYYAGDLQRCRRPPSNTEERAMSSKMCVYENVTEQFNRAADIMQLDPDVRKILEKPSTK